MHKKKTKFKNIGRMENEHEDIENIKTKIS